MTNDGEDTHDELEVTLGLELVVCVVGGSLMIY